MLKLFNVFVYMFVHLYALVWAVPTWISLKKQNLFVNTQAGNAGEFSCTGNASYVTKVLPLTLSPRFRARMPTLVWGFVVDVSVVLLVNTGQSFSSTDR